MSMLKTIKMFFFRAISKIIRDIELYNFFNYPNDNRPTASFKLLYFCGKSGVKYLNASLFSVYHSWEYLPDIIIVSDGTPLSFFKENLIKWPRNISIISWEDCANYNNKGNSDLFKYASNDLWGKKFAALLYCAANFPTLFSDSDVLWFSSPKVVDIELKPIIKMSQDVAFFYSKKIIEFLEEEECFDSVPLNAGVIYLNGDFSSYPKWNKLCKFLSDNSGLQFSEQTICAILNNHFNKDNFLREYEVVTKIDDKYSLRYTKKYIPNMISRHYVNTKDVAFWRDFIYLCISKRLKY